MKNAVFLLSIVIFCSFNINTPSYKLPEIWEKDFSIKLYQGGGMYYGSTTIIFDANGLVYNVMDHGKEKIKKFKLSENEKTEILKQLELLNIDCIKTKQKLGITYDQATTSICFMKDANVAFCVDESASNEIEEEYKNNFRDAWSFLQNFAIKKTK